MYRHLIYLRMCKVLLYILPGCLCKSSNILIWLRVESKRVNGWQKEITNPTLRRQFKEESHMGDSGRDKRRWRRDVCGYEHTFWVNKIIMKCVNVFLSFPVLYAGNRKLPKQKHRHRARMTRINNRKGSQLLAYGHPVSVHFVRRKRILKLHREWS